MEEVSNEFERTHGVAVERHYGASEDLLTRIQFQPEHETADIFLPADESYVEKARQKGWVKDSVPLATMKAVVMIGEVEEGKIRDWPTMLEHRISLANENAAIGQLTREHLKKTGEWARLEPKLVGVLNVAEAANAVKIGVLPAAIVWEPVAKNYPNLKRLELPELKGIEAKIVAAGLTKNPYTQKFLDALVSPEHGKPMLEKYHFTPLADR
jgi:molybdate transport system substrate-binding protein